MFIILLEHVMIELTCYAGWLGGLVFRNQKQTYILVDFPACSFFE